MQSFEKIISSIKEVKVLNNETGNKKRLIKIVNTQKCLLECMRLMHSSGSFGANTLETFVVNLNRKISNGYTFGNSNDSIMECLKYYFQLYASTIPSDIDDKDILLVKKMSTELFGDYDSFLFISNIIDDDIIFKGAVIFMLNNFNKRLSEHKIILIPYIRKN